MRKYAALSGLTEETLRQFVVLRPVRIGEVRPPPPHTHTHTPSHRTLAPPACGRP